jgi:uncharacterized protein YkwD
MASDPQPETQAPDPCQGADVCQGGQVSASEDQHKRSVEDDDLQPAPTDPPLAPAKIQHVVQPGDTLLGLAMKHNISMASIQLANNMGNTIDLIAGQTLNIPNGPQWLQESCFWIVHVVQPGETLMELSSAYDTSVDQILRVNAIADPTLINVDQQLVIPLTQLLIAQRPEPTTAPATLAEAAQAIPPTPQPNADTDAAASMAVAAPTTAPQPTEPASNTETDPPPSLPAGPAEWPNYILTRINQARAANGLHALTIAPELTYAAQAHAQDCAQRGWGSHVGSDGAVLKTRVQRAGYTGDRWGENWVQAQNAERAFDWWYGEIPPNDPHRRNILSPHYTEIGIGIANSGWGYIFITDFGRR